MPLFPRPEVDNLKPSFHGGIDYTELAEMGIDPDEVLDFSAGANPFGPPPGVKTALKMIAIDRYPDSKATKLRQQLAVKLGVNQENLLAGNGSTELIRLASLVFFSAIDTVLIIEPTFGEYEVACQFTGCQIVKQRLQSAEGFRPKIEDTIGLIRQYHPKGIFLCNPNNPTGQYLTREELRQLLASCQDSLLILDEAFIAFADNSWRSVDLIEEGNLLILRSMTKDYALAGLRVGYVIAPSEIISLLRRVCPPWNVNSIAQQAAILALNEEDYLDWCRDRLHEARDYLIEELMHSGFQPLPSATDFFLLPVGDAAKFRLKLLGRGILVRDCTSFGLPQYVRIATRTLPECQKLITAIKEINATES